MGGFDFPGGLELPTAGPAVLVVKCACECTRAVNSLDLILNILCKLTVKIIVMETVALCLQSEIF